jgi:hypothetical protein
MRVTSRWLYPCLMALLGACGGDDSGDIRPDPAFLDRGAPRTAEQRELDRLRALGYAGVSEEVAEDSQSGVVHHQPRLSQPGYNVYTNSRQCSVVLMDESGRELRRWERPGHRSWSNSQFLENGDLVVIGQEWREPDLGALSEPRYLLRLGFDGVERWKVEMNAHHDLEVTPDGKLAVLSFRREADPGLEPGVELREDTVELLSLEGERLEERSLYDMLLSRPDRFEIGPVEPVEKEGVRFLDLLHSNSVEFLEQPKKAEPFELFAPGNVLVSLRHQDSVVVFRWETGELVWAWGRGELIGPHDATLLDNGHLLIFDNGLGRGWSRIVELDPRTEEIVWEYKAKQPSSFYTGSRGSNQRLANGNTLIAESDAARALEVTPGAKSVWAWVNPERDDEGRLVTIVRMKRFPASFFEPFLSRQ